MSNQGTLSRRLLLILLGCGLFTAGGLSGWLAARLLSEPTGHVEAASAKGVQPVVVPTGQEGLLVQSGEINPHDKPQEFDVFFVRPYASPPELKIVDAGPMFIYEIADQRPQGFRLKVTGLRQDGTLGQYQARGVVAK